jgi:geranyl-CoA carboxylase alpha subunit
MTARRFSTILVANRGEIAIRIIRSARRLGFRTVAVYSEADRDAPHCRAADLALPIGAAAPMASYLNVGALLAAAKAGGADAVHPGYGFLAENAGFAQACLDAGLVFIGPSPSGIAAMGNKGEAKRLMQAAGVPCVPGYQGGDQLEARMLEEAARVGYPVMIKAAAGGGGRGMRRVGHAREFAAALQSARSEALHAFGSGELILERAIVEPRHIEVQVFADMHGNVVHLGERDCSVQRRHQKVIEESPSPGVAPQLRARMGEVAVAAARAIGYRGAGTLEFLLDRDGNFYFMEMNTRLQVEHAVTEAVLGVDLVEWQLRVAGGEALPLAQHQVDARLAQGGHAIEVRLCAEDPERGFMPQSGVVARWRAPAHVRTDHALESGLAVPPFYDSMLAKIVAHGADRPEALRRLAYALDECVLLGVASNRHFLARCLAHPVFAAGEATTAFVEACFPPAARAPAAPDPLAILAGAALLAWRRSRAASTSASASAPFPDELRGWSNGAAYRQLTRFVLDGEAVQLFVAPLGDKGWNIIHGVAPVAVHARAAGENAVLLSIGGSELRVEYVFEVSDGATCHFLLAGREHSMTDTTWQRVARDAAGAGGSRSGRISAPMNGRIVNLPVREGEQVRAGQLLVVIEAMKMEHSIVAPFDGTVQALFATLGDQVAPGCALVEIVEIAAADI